LIIVQLGHYVKNMTDWEEFFRKLVRGEFQLERISSFKITGLLFL
jgi:hypothetical protein